MSHRLKSISTHKILHRPLTWSLIRARSMGKSHELSIDAQRPSPSSRLTPRDLDAFKKYLGAILSTFKRG
ncbi:hypothetical protein BHM03_00062732 [Ensete ventricosum]|nr:hypothetical protein BHM03_00062732 [Ensete ventricosum]